LNSKPKANKHGVEWSRILSFNMVSPNITESSLVVQVTSQRLQQADNDQRDRGFAAVIVGLFGFLTDTPRHPWGTVPS
jgi:hypothetical protein